MNETHGRAEVRCANLFDNEPTAPTPWNFGFSWNADAIKGKTPQVTEKQNHIPEERTVPRVVATDHTLVRPSPQATELVTCSLQVSAPARPTPEIKYLFWWVVVVVVVI
jgi:hypothetical protein